MIFHSLCAAVWAEMMAEALGPICATEKEPISTAIMVCTMLPPVKQPGVKGL